MDNGDEIEIVTPPHIKVVWNAAEQIVGLEFDNKEFKTWDYIMGILAMATEHAKMCKNMAMMQGMQRTAIEQQQAAAIRSKLRGGL